ncbi:hypothetical protein [Candidatus Velamenicoccus archaeovorus]|nr:hypothetical protein [Candidatus Velamenicoccus archaeovorus]
MEEKNKQPEAKKKGFWSRWFEAMDNKLQQKARAGCCCRKGDAKKGPSCC